MEEEQRLPNITQFGFNKGFNKDKYKKQIYTCKGFKKEEYPRAVKAFLVLFDHSHIFD